MDLKKEMEVIKAKKEPMKVEMQRYIKYALGQKMDEEAILKEVGSLWGKDNVKLLIENIKNTENRNFVHYQEPLNSDGYKY